MLDPSWNGSLKNPVQFLATSDGAGWRGARFIEFLSPPENEVDITHQQVCIQRFLGPAELLFAGTTCPAPLCPGVHIATPGAREKAAIWGQLRGQFLFIDDALIARWLRPAVAGGAASFPIRNGPATQASMLEKLLDCLHATLTNNPDAMIDESFFEGVLRAVVSCLAHSPAQASLRPQGSRWTKVYELLKNADLQDLNIDTLAQAASVSARHFGRLFKDAHQCTPHQFLLKYRLSVAEQALADTSRSLADIALACGFSDQSQFSQAFKKHYGVPPLKMRLRLING